ncbi:C6 zinc finger domain protein [Penicillium hispanicum]|uniref:C6 zinc finger domain protein n=1 Tax=Penicillium hispanicum TaxID=1080232 RepID=UPI002540E060|nr:C6 zinc finger domain protein [Penicillium hispanicum]KAJ5577432.1 C6 zinc finger domain protein [Penicillium hispanicum]
MDRKDQTQLARPTARKPLLRVRTGCITCRIRKVKCDESRPSCTRCTSTGRKCDGYMTAPKSTVTYIRPAHLPSIDRLSLRSLEFYHQTVAPVLSTPSGRSFWMNEVAQLTHSEPAAMHAVIAISALYEQMNPGSRTSRPAYDAAFHLRHYNIAIKQISAIKAPRPDQIHVLLMVCIMFTRIEFLRGQKDEALAHLRHGITILNSYAPNSRLASIFRHLSLNTLFTNPSVNKDLPMIISGGCPYAYAPFESLGQAEQSLDCLQYHSLRLSHIRDQHRQAPSIAPKYPRTMLSLEQKVASTIDGWNRTFASGEEHSQKRDEILLPPPAPVDYPRSVNELQKKFNIALDDWTTSFQKLKGKRDDHKNESLARILEMRWLVSKIWALCCLQDESVYETQVDKFERIVEIASQPLPAHDLLWWENPRFMFETGYAPQLYFVVQNCRKLPIRLKALSLMYHEPREGEMMWNSVLMYDLGRQTIEADHGIQLRSKKTQPVTIQDGCTPLKVTSYWPWGFTNAESE